MAEAWHIQNYTPHPVTLNHKLVLQSCLPKVGLRLHAEQEEETHEINIPGTTIKVAEPPRFTSLMNADDVSEEHTVILVSMPVGNFLRMNPDVLPHVSNVFGPDTGPEHAVRDDRGNPCGSTRLIRYR